MASTHQTRIFSVLEFADLLEADSDVLSPLSGTSLVAVTGCIDAVQHSRLSALAQTRLPQCPVVGWNIEHPNRPRSADMPAWFDCQLTGEAEFSAVESAVGRNPRAAAVLVQLLRATAQQSVQQALLAESLAYSTLQHGAEFERWLALRAPQHSVTDDAPVLLVVREGKHLQLILNRPAKRNAWSADLRDALCEALQLALLDPTIESIDLCGNGPAFCAGGDLNEFGAARDAAVAHLSRTTLSAAALLHRLRDKVCVRVHGACVGAGIELPAYAIRVEAHADSFFQLPEVSMGLIPGAGGTVSLPRRIGRHRTAWLALSGERLSAETALAWGLIDALVE